MIKYFFTLLVACIISFVASAQAPQIQWQKCLGGINTEYSYDIRQTVDSGYVIVGENSSLGYGSSDGWVIKLAPSGAIEWQKRLGGSQDDWALSVQQTFDGGYMVACNTTSSDSDVSFIHGAKDIWLVKLSSSGDILWERSYGGTDDDGVISLLQTPDRGFIVAGYTRSGDGDISVNKGGNDVWILKVDSAGTIQWQNTYGGTANDYATSIQLLNNGYVIAGYTESSNGDVTLNHGYDDTWIIRISDSGALVWQKTFGGSQYDYANDIVVTSDSGFVVVGGTSSTDGDVVGNHGNADQWVLRLSSSGSILWQKCLGSSGTDEATSVYLASDGRVLVSGWVGANDGDVSGFHGINDFWIASLTPVGSIMWQRSFGGVNSDVPFGFQLTNDGGYIMTGSTLSNGDDVTGFHGGSDIWVVKLNTPTEIPLLPGTQSITCAPNPTSDKLTIIGANDVDISVYSLNGQLLKYNAHTNEISISDLPAGIYTITVATGDVITYTGKIEKR